MLIRLVSHFKNNPKHIDKMIAIKGLPEAWLFREGPSGKELLHPWKADVDKNIPYDIRSLCEPMYITFRYPPISRGENWVVEYKQILGIVLDFMSEPGREMWEQIDRYLQGTIPRTERVPDPVVLAKDEHSAFETYAPKRSSTGSLQFEPSPIPLIDLTLYAPKVIPVVEQPPVVPPVKDEPPVPKAPAPQPTLLKCDKCDYTNKSKPGIQMHKYKKHPIQQKVGV